MLQTLTSVREGQRLLTCTLLKLSERIACTENKYPSSLLEYSQGIIVGLGHV